MNFLFLLGVVAWCVSSVASAEVDLDFVGEPSINDKVVQHHLRSRSEMITQEMGQRQDHAFRQSLSPVARRADAIVRAIRQEEIDQFWRVPGVVGDEERERFAGEMFPKARPHIGNTTLWSIVKRMPKGALLHAHLQAMLPADVLLDAVLHTEGMVISASQDVSTPLKRENATIMFAHVNHTLNEIHRSIHDTDYVPNSQIPINQAADTFPGGRPAFLEFVKTKITILPGDSVRHDLGVDEIWRKFQKCFGPLTEILTYEPIVRTFYRKLFERLVDDGINWVEIRTAPGEIVHNGNEATDPNPDAWWHVLHEEIESFQKTSKGRGFWGARVIWTDLRGSNRTLIAENMKLALGQKQKFPYLVSGYDLVGQEDLGHSLFELAPELVWFRKQTEILNVTIPFFFHAGETLGDGNSTDLNLFDALLFQTRRIGHGFSLYKHPKLTHEVIQKTVLVEVCPISNEVLRLATDILHHPLPAMVAHGVPTAISNDDPSILGQDIAGLSYDFYQTIQGFDNTGLAGLGALAQNSIRWANFQDQPHSDWIRDIQLGERGQGIKARHLQSWNAQWEIFCQWIVDTHGAKYPTAEVDDHA
ncbi:Metallo-dependent hydrolase [Aspergillus campestris IBT 28561]|uniref:adenosine deaminase n=1 Tax=Aspergillus campestris (strain IBT 28561) TaxID=1392248 RepID=A0A2I1D021_ASPC2|nr:Metallo-dependent hydrolase [Aspergillus campestris IBT 28561]PKY03209.1 Metallo-dependent hydrolase [Aspergillus campestris IBT 28561]